MQTAATISTFPRRLERAHEHAQSNARLRSSRARGVHMTNYSVSKAAAAVGRDRASIRRAIAAGKISAMRDAASGQWRIDPAELHRVYPPVRTHERNADDAPSRPTDSDARLATAEAHIGEMQETARMRDETIADLRRRLDRADDERERLQAQLGDALQQVRALTDQRAAVPAAPIEPPPARRSWWRWRRARSGA